MIHFVDINFNIIETVCNLTVVPRIGETVKLYNGAWLYYKVLNIQHNIIKDKAFATDIDYSIVYIILAEDKGKEDLR